MKNKPSYENLVSKISELEKEKNELLSKLNRKNDLEEENINEQAKKSTYNTSEEKYKSIVEAEPECVKILDKNGSLIDMNPAGLAMIDAESLDQVKGKSVINLISKEYQKDFLTMIRNVFEGKKQRLTFEIVGLKGSHRWLESHAVPLYDNKNKVVNLLGVTRDITEYIKADEELKNKNKELERINEEIHLAKDRIEVSEKKYTELFEKSGDAILILENGNFIDCNNATVEMLKYKSKQEFLNVHPSKLSPDFQPDGRKSSPKADEMMKIALKKGSHRFEWNHVRSDGTIFPVEVLLTAISNKRNHKVIHTVWRDITNKKQNEVKIKEFSKFQKIIADLSTKFISLPIEKFDMVINQALSLLGKNLRSDRAYVFIYSEDYSKMSNTHEWCNQNINPYKDELQNIPSDWFLWNHKQLINGKTIVVSDVALMGDDAKHEKEEFEKEGIQSILITPFLHNNQIIGFIGVDFVKRKRSFTEEDENALRAFGNIMGQALVRKKYEQSLQKAKLKAEESELHKKQILDSTAEGILAVNNQGEVLYNNSRFADMLNIPAEIINQKSDKIIQQFIESQLIDTKKFISNNLKLYKSKADSFDILEFKNGRFIGRISAPIIRAQKISGRVWNFRDMTKQIKSEKKQAVLYNISKFANESSHLRTFLEKVHSELSSLIVTENFYVALYHPEEDKYSFAYHVDKFDNYDNPEELIEIRQSLTDYTRRNAKPIIVDKKYDEELRKKGEIKLIGEPSAIWLGAPLIDSQGNSIGIISVQDYETSNAYAGSDLELLNFVARNIGTLI